MSDINEETFNYYFFKSNRVCPICKNIPSLECYNKHGIEYYDYLLQKNFYLHCPTCKKKIQSYIYSKSHAHIHGMKDCCIWCTQSWHSLHSNPDDVIHLLLCYKQFMKNVLPPKVPSTNNDYFKKDIKKKLCPICSNTLFGYSICTLVKCRHQFHWACLSNWALEYFVDYCPICFTHIDNRYLKKYGYAIEWQTLGNYCFGRRVLHLLFPNEEVRYYFEVLRIFFELKSMTKQKPHRDVNIYPRWTLERLKRRFACMTEGSILIKYHMCDYSVFSIVYLLNYLNYHVFPDTNEMCLTEIMDSELLKLSDGCENCLQDFKYENMTGERKTVLCTICLEDFNLGEANTQLSCKHLFHQECISEWLRKMGGELIICPICDPCSICLQTFDLGKANTLLSCKHLFHHECISEWLQKFRSELKTCPICRQKTLNDGKNW